MFDPKKVETAAYWITVLTNALDDMADGPAPDVTETDLDDFLDYNPGLKAPEGSGEKEWQFQLGEAIESLVAAGKMVRNDGKHAPASDDRYAPLVPAAMNNAAYGFMRARMIVDVGEARRIARIRFLDGLGIDRNESPDDAAFLDRFCDQVMH